MLFNNYLFRPHAIVKIMGGVPKPLTSNQEKTYNDLFERHNGDGKKLTLKQVETLGSLSERKNAKCKLSDSAKKELMKLVFENLTKRSNKIKAKYLDKGIQQEDKSITTYSNVLDKLLLKNKERKTNDFFTGECDNSQDMIRDIKTSWSFESFPLMDEVIKNSGYQWQLDCYMDLWNLKKSELVYCLVDTPEKLLNDELKRLDWKHNILNNEGEVKDENGKQLLIETVCNHIFTFKGLTTFCESNSIVQLEWFEGVFVEIPEEMRVKVFSHDYCAQRNAQLKEMIALARDYMNEILMTIPDNQKKLIELKETQKAA